MTFGEDDDPRVRAVLSRLSGSRFRSRFGLTQADAAYLRSRGPNTIREHADRFILERLAPAEPAKDGRQTPWRGHPVFVAQHATGVCCRGCIRTWHGILPGEPLTDQQCDYLARVIMTWLTDRLRSLPAPPAAPPGDD